jgi:hypothetical protein
MTKTTTKTAAAETAAEKIETVGVDATQKVAETTKAITNVFSALTQATRKTVEGVIAVDKTLLGYAKNAVTSYVDLGKASLQAKCLNDLIDLQAAYAHNSIETTAANAREVVDMSRTKAKEAYAPVKEIIDTYKPGKAA